MLLQFVAVGFAVLTSPALGRLPASDSGGCDFVHKHNANTYTQ